MNPSSNKVPVDFPLPPKTAIGFAAAFIAVIVVAATSYVSLYNRDIAVDRISHTQAVIDNLKSVSSRLINAETAQRGYLLTGDERYLAPYEEARISLPGEFDRTLREIGSDDAQQQRLATIRQIAAEKMALAADTIDLRRAGKAEEALAIVHSDRGREMMARFRTLAAEMEGGERQAFVLRNEEWKAASTLSIIIAMGGSSLLLVLVGIAAVITSRDYRAAQANAWLRTGQTIIGERMRGDLPLEALGNVVLEFLTDYLDAQVGAVYTTSNQRDFSLVAGYALPSAHPSIRAGEGLLGEVAKLNRALHVRDVPDNYLSVSSSLGQSTSREILLAPATVDGVVHGVVELGFFRPISDLDEQLLARVSETLGIALRSSKDRSRLEELLEKTQHQAEELQTQQEELRVSNEELEEQGRVLRESEAELQAQQAELEQINSHLEEQTQLLELQKVELVQAQIVLSEKADELERTHQYKNEFLANMSHELRTPLNSTLILAKLLADNKDENLTPEQVRFAQTISSAGKDLLMLINDILDLSKIEAGKVEMEPTKIGVGATVDSLVKIFEPQAAEKGLTLSLHVDASAPSHIESDPQRLGQIIKNLLSNALKFTERGTVSVRVFSSADNTISFAVQDTGIGIPEQQHAIIFEAFRQADGSTHRKYGGTGLGLSISRDLAKLLGGNLSMQSSAGQGSVFTLTLPIKYEGSAATHVESAASIPSNKPPRSVPLAPSIEPAEPELVDDDRAHLTPDGRLILVIEDDVSFAEILRDLAHELGFQCVITHSAEEGLIAVSKYQPNAIVLDMNLPDSFGLSVLDKLKHRPGTRHIPVHVVSVSDYTQTALERGAIGYALKPVKRERLVEAFRQLEAKFSQSARRVLVVEDDARQRQSIGQLLGSEDVQIIGVETAGEALTQLRGLTFDCVVMDLNLPDFSGYELLEKMAAESDVSFPPVIVYTGRSLTRDEEQGLRRFSKSIIIKDARSPERLLDEVTLFLHQVESKMPIERQRMLKAARNREALFEDRRILIVEDDARNIFALTSILEPRGAHIEVARNGQEALNFLQSRSARDVDLVLMDLMMPEMDGLTAMREIRKQPEWKNLPIIALTAKAMQDDRERSLAAGATDYIAKPLDVEKLLSLMRVWMPKLS